MQYVTLREKNRTKRARKEKSERSRFRASFNGFSRFRGQKISHLLLSPLLAFVMENIIIPEHRDSVKKRKKNCKGKIYGGSIILRLEC